MANKKDITLRSEYLKTVTQLATAGFGLAAALAWNDFIKSVINKFISPGNGIVSQLIYVLIITLFAVIVTIKLGNMSQEAKEEEEKK